MSPDLRRAFGVEDESTLLNRMTDNLHVTSRNRPSQPRNRRRSDADLTSLSAGTVPQFLRFRQDPSSIIQTSRTSGLEGETNRYTLDRCHEHLCRSEDCAIARLFRTPELVELVFTFLDFKTICTARLVNQSWRSAIHEAKQLHLRFFLSAQWTRPRADYQLLSFGCTGVDIVRGKELHLGQWLEVTFTPEAAKRIAPVPTPQKRVRARSIFEGLQGGLGAAARMNPSWPAVEVESVVDRELRCEDLLIAQPPVIGMQAFVIRLTAAIHEGTDETGANEPAASAKLSCDTGITLGFLAETAQTLLTQVEDSSNLEGLKILYRAIMSFSEPKQTSQRPRNGKRVVYYL